GAPSPRPSAATGSMLGELKAEEATAESEMLGGGEVSGGEVDENDSAVIRLANQVIMDAFKARASDIHIEPYGMQKDTVVRFRVDGTCSEYQKIPGAFRRAIVTRIKIMAQLDIAERRKPQDGKIRFKTAEGREM